MAVGTGFVYQSLNYIPMAETIVIFQTNTIWSQFLIHLINKETITKNRLINTVVCFIGIILIVNPKFDNANSITHTIGCLLAFITSIT
jgi:drug/metabolite transporter (DMT)-like permease